MSTGNVIVAAICWLCAIYFGLIALWAFRRKDPVHFWAGSVVKPEEIADIPAYNRSNGIMWLVYTACLFLTGVLSVVNPKIGAIAVGIMCVPGIFALVFVYKGIYKKYRRPAE